MSITLEDVRLTANVSRIAMDDAELADTHAKLKAMLEHIELLDELDIEHVEATTQGIQLRNVWRDDVAIEGLTQEQALKNAADSRHGFFAVAAVMGSDEGASA